MEQAAVDQEEQARRNRQAMPEFARWLGEWRGVFGPVRVLYAREGDVEVGKRFEDRLVNGRLPC